MQIIGHPGMCLCWWNLEKDCWDGLKPWPLVGLQHVQHSGQHLNYDAGPPASDLGTCHPYMHYAYTCLVTNILPAG